MAKPMRATYIIANLLNGRPENESLEAFSTRIGLTYTLDVDRLNRRKDIVTGIFYRVCKALGYQIIVYNPNPPKGLEKMYVVGERKATVLPREYTGIHKIRRDSYTGAIYRVPRTYKKKKFKKVSK